MDGKKRTSIIISLDYIHVAYRIKHGELGNKAASLEQRFLMGFCSDLHLRVDGRTIQGRSTCPKIGETLKNPRSRVFNFPRSRTKHLEVLRNRFLKSKIL